MATVKTRGPRTPDERATDAARTAATLFAKLPPSPYADKILKPLAVLLRFDRSTSAYLDQEQTEEAADAYRDIVDNWSRIEELELSHRRHRERAAVAMFEDATGALTAQIERLERAAGIERPRPKLKLVPGEANGDG